jgi:hypothetical protein
MKNAKLVLAHIVSLLLLFICGCGMAFAQSNFSEFHRNHWRQDPPPPVPAPVPPADPSTTPNPDCSLILPPNPLTATGLSTPFVLVATDTTQGPCNETNTAQSAFVQAAIFDPATFQISIYNPLIIDQGTSPAALPVVPTLPANAIVALWFGYNANNLTLVATSPDTLDKSSCVNGTTGSVFSQYSYCNAVAFFKAANQAIANGQLTVPPLGTALDGLACPSVRDFFVVDQDQSDNLPTTYLITASGQLAQYTQINLGIFPGATHLGNPSDNRLTDVFLDGALKCQPWTAPDLADPGQNVPALALNELQARMNQQTPVALVPSGDPMAEVSGTEDMNKLNLYRAGVDQPLADSSIDGNTARYCRQMLRIAPRRMFRDEGILKGFKSPDPGAADTLFTFLAQRFVASYQILNCDSLIHKPVPITVSADSNGVVIHARLSILDYIRELEDIQNRKAADDAADSASNSLLTTE